MILAGLAAVISMRPGSFTVSRSASISAPAADVFAQVNDFHNWEAWSPWAKMDPDAKNTYSGAAAGSGASFAWSGNRKVGAGNMSITESRPAERIEIRIEFTKPFKAVNTVLFTFAPEGGKTSVTWSMAGKNNFAGKAVGLFMDCDKMIGSQYDKGLAQLAATVEKK